MAKSKGSGAWGLAGLAAAAAGAYYFYGKNGKQNRKQLKGWMVKAQGEVMEQVENLTEVSKKSYHEAVARVLKKYKTLKRATPAELAGLARELKGHWDAIQAELDKVQKKPASRSRTK